METNSKDTKLIADAIIGKQLHLLKQKHPQITSIEGVYDLVSQTTKIAIYYYPFGPSILIDDSLCQFEVILVKDYAKSNPVVSHKELLHSDQIDLLTQLVRKHALSLFEKHSNILAIHGGWKIRDFVMTRIPSFRIFLKTKGLVPIGEPAIPTSIATDVIEARFSKLVSEYQSNVKIGASIGIKGQNEFGTLGCFVSNSNKTNLLTNAHLFANSDPNAIVTQPADVHTKKTINHLESTKQDLIDTISLIGKNLIEGDFIGRDILETQLQDCTEELEHVTRELKREAILDRDFAIYKGNCFWNNFSCQGLFCGIDAAIAEIIPYSRQIHRLPWFSISPGWSKLPFGKLVNKMGSSTGVTQGVLMEIPAYYRDRYFIGENQLLVAEENHEFCKEGDSGSVVWDGGLAVALLHGVIRSAIGHFAVSSPMFAVAKCLEIQ